MLKRFLSRILGATGLLYVIADSSDNSITFSRLLFSHIRRNAPAGAATVFVFRIPDSGDYAFAVNPPIHTKTVIADIQYNPKHRCIGFESLCPTVNRIFYDYAVPLGRKRLRVAPKFLCSGGLGYYVIRRPS